MPDAPAPAALVAAPATAPAPSSEGIKLPPRTATISVTPKSPQMTKALGELGKKAGIAP
jgi:hypothetical protein